jgi:hypothetical protein
MSENIALGFGNNIDYEIVWDSYIFEQLILKFGISSSELCHDKSINNVRDLIISILSFLKEENSGERFVKSPVIIEDFASYFEKKITLGGTSIRAAIAMQKLGKTSALHLVTINDAVRKLIPQDCPWVCSNNKDSFYPHLIVQYCKDTYIHAGDITIRTKQANRIIYVNDYDNAIMKINPDFAQLATNAKILLISGFNAMQSMELLADRLRIVLQIINCMQSNALVFYESACFHKPALSSFIHKTLIDAIDFFSMNENEFQEILGREISLLDAKEVFIALQKLHQLIPAPALIIHTRYWSIVFGKNAAQYSKALKAGIVMATTRLRFGDDFNSTNYLETEGLPLEPIGEEFAEKINREAKGQIHCMPSFHVEESKMTTIGLGDAFVGGFLSALV